jgi:hypothetical protein
MANSQHASRALPAATGTAATPAAMPLAAAMATARLDTAMARGRSTDAAVLPAAAEAAAGEATCYHQSAPGCRCMIGVLWCRWEGGRRPVFVTAAAGTSRGVRGGGRPW